MSLAIKSAPGIAGHRHRFIFIGIDGHSMLARSCEDDIGGAVSANADDPEAVVLLKGLYDTGQTGLADAWRRQLLDESTARAAGFKLSTLDVPIEGFATSGDFLSWQNDHHAEVAGGGQ